MIKLIALLKLAWADALEYRAQLLIWVVTGTLPLVMLAVWLQLGAGGAVAGYRGSDFVAYYIAALCLRQLTGVWVIWDMEREIRLGELSPQLLRPVHPLWRYLSMALADKPLRLLMTVPIALIAAVAVPQAIPQPDALSLLLLGPALLLAFLLYFLNQACIGCLAFWWTQVLALQDFWYGLYALAGGYLVPLDLFPPSVSALLAWLPFRGMLAYPIDLALGRLDAAAAWSGLLHQLVWCAVLFLLLQLLWRRGLRRYGAIGA